MITYNLYSFLRVRKEYSKSGILTESIKNDMGFFESGRSIIHLFEFDESKLREDLGGLDQSKHTHNLSHLTFRDSFWDASNPYLSDQYLMALDSSLPLIVAD